MSDLDTSRVPGDGARHNLFLKTVGEVDGLDILGDLHDSPVRLGQKGQVGKKTRTKKSARRLISPQ